MTLKAILDLGNTKKVSKLFPIQTVNQIGKFLKCEITDNQREELIAAMEPYLDNLANIKYLKRH